MLQFSAMPGQFGSSLIATLVLCLGLGASQTSNASEPVFELHVFEALPVYAQPDLQSEVIATLEEGELVVISARIFGSFRQVRVPQDGKTIQGYVSRKSIHFSEIHERSRPRKKDARAYGQKYALGLAGVVSFIRQGATDFEMSDTTTYETSEFTSFSYFFSVFLDSSLKPGWGLRSYLCLRETDFSGQVKEKNSPSPSPLDSKATREQSLIGAGLVAKNYGQAPRRWWWGPGLELAKGTALTVKVDGIKLPTTEEDKPFFVMAFGAAGAEVPLAKNIYWVPDVRLGTILTTKPVSLYAETFVGLSYLF